MRMPILKIGAIAFCKVYGTSMSMWMESTCIRTVTEYLEKCCLGWYRSQWGKYSEVLGEAKSMKKDRTNWVSFFLWLWDCGLDGVKLILVYMYLGVEKSVNEALSFAGWLHLHQDRYINLWNTLNSIPIQSWNRHINNKISISPYPRPAVADSRHVSTFLYLFFLGGISKAFEKITETKLFYYE